MNKAIDHGAGNTFEGVDFSNKEVLDGSIERIMLSDSHGYRMEGSVDAVNDGYLFREYVRFDIAIVGSALGYFSVLPKTNYDYLKQVLEFKSSKDFLGKNVFAIYDYSKGVRLTDLAIMDLKEQLYKT